MPYAPDRHHNLCHGVQSDTPLLQSKTIIPLRQIPTLLHASVTPSYAESSLRLGLIVPLTLVSHPLRRSSQHHVHHLPPAIIAPTPTVPPLSSSLLRDTLVGISRIQDASPTDKDTSTPISDTETITQSSLCTVPQGRYAPPSKSAQTRYGNISEPTLDCVDFSCGPEKDGCSMTVAQILEGLSDAYLEGANETVLERHGTNIKLHILWPGYAPWGALVRTKSWKDSSVPITRGELALRLARALERFTVSAKRDVSAASSTISVPSSIALGSLYLLSFYRVTQGAWQVELATVAPGRNE
ncbi:uncharacterized protein STEHIDRAFT_153034 [Stereum hirsutum FP-91666 SS1]|uniref:uncharacterized protein n=1 Tax=Stereum hirsutum (strain FP-91666) TaxID=721885 RepID=UPI000440FE66|nr:uncharacterized protein STEHIDRAFT_153034 [Stereum hirsutum FP-91666 SS1]EIM91389.1 hypothetical protein STEHIDRAFT_153034 [Stereum hirsutum FP-91666 SS1]